MQPRPWRLLVVILALLALVAAACGDDDDDTSTDTEAPGDTTGTTGGTTAPAGDLTACQVSDTGGIDDRSFNETAFAGLEQAETELGADISFLESQSVDDFAPNIDQFVSQGCDVIVTVGFLLGDATAAAAAENPTQPFVIVDYAYDPEIDNVLALTFQTDQAAFLAGYLAAGMTQSGIVGTYGGLNIPTVTIFMDGLLAGIEHYNEVKGTTVELLGWDGSEGLFTGDFENIDNGIRNTQSLLDEGADIIMPVAGPVGQGTGQALEQAGEGMMIWVDTDGYLSTDYGDIVLTSVEKRMDLAVFEAIKSQADGMFAGGTYVGTLENDGVGISPFHDFEDDVPAELAAEVEQLRLDVIAGTITVGG